MIVKLAYRHFAGRVGEMSPTARPAPCNDNHVRRRLGAYRQRTLRHVPVCHWRVQPLTGVLECFWLTEGVPTGTATDEDPALCRLTARTRRSRTSFAAGATGVLSAAV